MASILNRAWSNQRIRYLSVGIYNTVFGYLVFALLWWGLGESIFYIWLLVLSHLISVINAYFSYRVLVFRVVGYWWSGFLKFNLVYLGSFGFNLVALPVLIQKFYVHPLVGQALIIVVTVFMSYILHSRFSFNINSGLGASFFSKKRFYDLILAIYPALVVFIFNILTFNKYFPLSEGWWEAYGYFINSGLSLFKDLDISFSPLFAFINAKLLNVTGNSFFFIRLSGVFLITLVVVFCQVLLRQFFSSKTAGLATILAAFMFIYSPQFIAKDYHTYLHFFVVLWLLILVKAASDKSRLYIYALFLFLGAISAVIFFLKQNVGVLLIASLVVSVCFLRKKIGEKFERIFLFLSGLIVAFYFIQGKIGFDMALVRDNDAKGSLFTVFFRFLTEDGNRSILFIAIVLATASIYSRYLFFAYQARVKDSIYYSIISERLSLFKEFFRDIVANEWVKILPVLLAGYLVTSSVLRAYVINAIIPISLSVIFIQCYRYFGFSSVKNKLNDSHQLMLLPLGSLAYANTNTAVFDANGMFEVSAYGIGYFLSQIESKYIILRRFFGGLFILLVSYVCLFKVIRPYEWWGNGQSNIFSAKYQSSYPELNSIYFDENTKNAFDVVSQNIKYYSESNRDVYLFNLPLFYVLEHKLSPGRLPVHWFDVVTTPQMQNELNFFDNNKPSVIVVYEPSDMAFTIHRKMKGKASLSQEDMIRKFDDLVENGEYYFSQSVILRDVLTTSYDDREVVSVDVRVQNYKVSGKKIAEIKSIFNYNNNVKFIASLHSNGMAISPDYSERVILGDILTLRGQKNDVLKLAESLGVIRGSTRTLNSITVYIEKSRFLKRV